SPRFCRVLATNDQSKKSLGLGAGLFNRPWRSMAANAMEPLLAVEPIPKEVMDPAQLPSRTKPNALGVPNDRVLGERIDDGLSNLCSRHRGAPREAIFELASPFLIIKLDRNQQAIDQQIKRSRA